jgi:hypothetical protein
MILRRLACTIPRISKKCGRDARTTKPANVIGLATMTPTKETQ